MSGGLLIPCLGCGSVNRVPEERLADLPVCGRCRLRLFQGHPVELTAANFETHIGRTGIPVVVDFWATWCGPCRSMAPVFIQAAEQLEPRVRFAKLNTEEEPGIAARYNISAIPTIMVFKNGLPVAEQAGAMSLPQLLSWIRSNL